MLNMGRNKITSKALLLLIFVHVDCALYRDEFYQMSSYVNITAFGSTGALNEISVTYPSARMCASYCMDHEDCAIFDDCRTGLDYVCLLWMGSVSTSGVSHDTGNCRRYKKVAECPDMDRYIYDEHQGCICRPLYHGDQCQYTYRDCEYIQATQGDVSGTYSLSFQGNNFEVYCEMLTDGPWVVFQKRIDTTINFGKLWSSYQNGFGNSNNWWLGLTKMTDLMQGDTYVLRIDMEANTGAVLHAKYGEFTIGDASTNYVLNVGQFSGNVVDSLSYHNGQQFTTFERDNDNYGGNCASIIAGGFWYNNCAAVRLNGAYNDLKWSKDGTPNGQNFILSKVSMKMKRKISS